MNLLGSLKDGVIDGGVGVLSQAAVRWGRSKTGMVAGTLQGNLVEFGLGIVAAMLGAKVGGVNIGRAAAQGAFMGPIAGYLKAANIPGVSAALGESDYVLAIPTSNMQGFADQNLPFNYNASSIPATVATGMDQPELSGYPAMHGYPAMSGYPSMGDFDTHAGAYGW